MLNRNVISVIAMAILGFILAGVICSCTSACSSQKEHYSPQSWDEMRDGVEANRDKMIEMGVLKE